MQAENFAKGLCRPCEWSPVIYLTQSPHFNAHNLAFDELEQILPQRRSYNRVQAKMTATYSAVILPYGLSKRRIVKNGIEACQRLLRVHKGDRVYPCSIRSILLA
jgi:hypothetical protein